MRVGLTTSKRLDVEKQIERARSIVSKEASYGDLSDGKMISDYTKCITDLTKILNDGFVILGVN
jgi:hypothetical protein